jgi:hypothetical protein
MGVIGAGAGRTGLLRAGVGRALRPAATLAVPAPAVAYRRDPAIWACRAGLTVPPFLGWWWLYQKFSTSSTAHRKW